MKKPDITFQYPQAEAMQAIQEGKNAIVVVMPMVGLVSTVEAVRAFQVYKSLWPGHVTGRSYR